MKINLNEILYAVSSGLDAAEGEYLGVTAGHSKRIAAISIIMGKALGLSDKDLIDLAAYAILHDNALTEFDQEQIEYMNYNNGIRYSDHDFLVRHCTIGEINTKLLPFRTNNRDVILLHHENALWHICPYGAYPEYRPHPASGRPFLPGWPPPSCHRLPAFPAPPSPYRQRPL